MNKLTKEQMADRLNSREYGSEIDSDEQRIAKESGLVVIYGASDDLCEFDGAISNEGDCYNGGTFYLSRAGLLEPHDEKECECDHCGYKSKKAQCAKVEAVWGEDGYSWTYRTDIPHATFDIGEDGEKYCRGIVIDIADLPDLKPTHERWWNEIGSAMRPLENEDTEQHAKRVTAAAFEAALKGGKL